MRRPRLVQHWTGHSARRNKMKEKKYEVLNGTNVLASNMDFQMAIVFIEGYRKVFYNEQLKLTIKEIMDNININTEQEIDYGYQE